MWIYEGTEERARRSSSERSTFSHSLISDDARAEPAYFTASLMNEEQPAVPVYRQRCSLEYACSRVLKRAGAESNTPLTHTQKNTLQGIKQKFHSLQLWEL